MDSNLKTANKMCHTALGQNHNLRNSDDNFDYINLDLKLDTDEKTKNIMKNSEQGQEILIQTNKRHNNKKDINLNSIENDGKFTKGTVSSKEHDYLSFDLSDNENSKEHSPEIVTKKIHVSGEKARKSLACQKSISVKGLKRKCADITNILKNSKSLINNRINFYKRASRTSLIEENINSDSKERPAISNAGINLRNDSSTKIYSRLRNCSSKKPRQSKPSSKKRLNSKFF